MLEIRLLGQFEIQIDGQPVALASRQAQALLAYLLLPPGRRHRRERVAGVLWPDVEETKARARLRYALWQLRRVLGPDLIQADKIEISCQPESEYWLDTAILERNAEKPRVTDGLVADVAVYAGDLLPGFYEEWVATERAHLRAVYEQKMEVALSRLLGERRYTETVELSERWLGTGQPPEKAYRALMAGHALMGDVAAAVKSYQRCVQMLDEELGLEPSSETGALYSLIAAGSTPAEILAGSGFGSAESLPSSTPTGDAAPVFPEAGDDEVLVAREDELEWLAQKWRAARSGAGSFALVTGEAGRGKSALLWSFAQDLQDGDPDVVIAAGRGEAYFGHGDPHLLFRDVLALLAGDVENRSARETISRSNARRLWELVPDTCRALLDRGPDLIGTFLSGDALYSRAQRVAGQDAAWVARLESHLRQVKDRPVPVHVAHADAQRALFEQYTRVLRVLAAGRPLLLLLDDLHWADRGSLDLLFHLGRRIQSERILIIAALRPDELAADADQDVHPLQKILAEFGRIFGEFELNLNQTDRRKGEQLSEALLDREPNRYDSGFRRRMYELTRGHPLFTLELLRQMRERGELVQDSRGRWYPEGDIDWRILPARVEAVIAGRILHLPGELRELLSAASIEGERFTAEVVASAVGRSADEVIRLLNRELHRRYSLVEPADFRTSGHNRLSRYRFQHHLFQKYLYERQEPALRAQGHESIARALEGVYGAELDSIAARLAFHFDQAGAVDETLRYLLMAGEYAKRQSADWEAVRALRRGLQLLQELPPSPERDRQELVFQIALGAPFVALYGWWSAEAEAAFERARELAESLGASEQLPPVLWGLWSYYLVRGKHALALAMAEQILERTKHDEQSDLILTAHWTLGISSAVAGMWKQARQHLEQAVSGYDPLAQRELTYRYGQSPGVTCLFWLALTLWMLGEPESAFARCRQSLELAEREDHTFSLAFGLACVAGLEAIADETDAARRNAVEALRLARSAGYQFLRAMGLIVKGWAGVNLGESGEPIQGVRLGLKIMDQSGARVFRPFFLALAAKAHLRLQDYGAAGEALDQALAVGREDGDHSVRAYLHQVRAEVLAAKGAAEREIVAELDRSLQIAREQSARQLEQRAARLQDELLGASAGAARQ